VLFRSQIVTVAQGLNDRDAMLRAARAIYLVAIPALLTLALIGGYVLAGRALAPVGKMAAQAREIGAATLSQRLRVPNAYDELGQLANVFNGLLDRLDRAFAQQRQFVADASHELRTPVAIVRGEAEVALAKDVRPEEEYRETLEIIHDEGRRMSRLVEDLFLLARADSGQLAPESTELYLDEVVGDSVRSLRTLAAARDISIEYETDGEMPLRGDEALLRRLVVNLVENAIKYGRAGRPVKVQAHRGSADEYVVSVLNEGVPISPADQHRVFDRFFRTSDGAPEVATTEGDSGGGAGLGLAIARWIAEAHGGKLELTRSDSEGTEFRAILPSP